MFVERAGCRLRRLFELKEELSCEGVAVVGLLLRLGFVEVVKKGGCVFEAFKW